MTPELPAAAASKLLRGGRALTMRACLTSRHTPTFLAANERYAAQFPLGRLQAHAARGLALLTCIDSRIEPLAMLGLQPGDAKVLRNAGARVTDDVFRTLVLPSYLPGVDR